MDLLMLMRAVWLYDKGLTKLPLKFNKVNGYFDCSYNKLTSLERIT